MSKEEILELLDELVARIEGPAVHVFELAVRNTLTGAIIGIVVSLLFLIAAVSLLRFSIRKFGDAYDDIGWGMLAGLSSIVGVLAFVFIFTNVHALLNVEYHALRSLVPGL